MTVLSSDGRNKFWFGTVDRMGWFPTPNRGADVSSIGWQAGGEMLNGGAYQLNSFGSAKNFIFEWPSSSAREVAQKMKSFADGAFGRGLIYFVDPLTWGTNVLPAHWAAPYMSVGLEAPTHIPGIEPTPQVAPGGASRDLPTHSAVYDLTKVGPTDPSKLDDYNSVFIPIPEGKILYLGAVYQASGSGGVYYAKVSRGGAVGSSTLLPAAPPEGVVDNGLFTGAVFAQPGEIGVRIWVGRSVSTPGVLTLTALIARIASFEDVWSSRLPLILDTPWVGGQGNSGCRFIGKPTYVNNTGVNGGQVGFSASFREVGSWAVG